MKPIKIVIHGACGRIGSTITNILCQEPGMKVVGAVEKKVSQDYLPLPDNSTVPFSSDLDHIISICQPDVLVDFTTPQASIAAARKAIRRGINLVIGTTELSDNEINEIELLAKEHNVGVMVEPTLSMEGILIRHLAKIASKYFDCAEIVELNSVKISAPAGTALALAKAMTVARGKPFQLPPQQGEIAASRGGQYAGTIIHSIRLGDARIHMEVTFGKPGALLTLKLELGSTESYREAVIKAIEGVVSRKGLITGDILLG